MTLEELNTKIERSPIYQFMNRHKRVLNVIQGLIIIGLLIGINSYVVKDHFIKKQIAERCGYTTSKLTCVCEKNYVDGWEASQLGQSLYLNMSEFKDVPLGG